MICTKCKTLKPEEEFAFRKDRGKRISICRPCKNSIDRSWAIKNPDKRRNSKSKCDKKLRGSRLRTKLKDNLRSRLNTAVKMYVDKGKVSHVRDLGCSLEELIVYLEHQFLPGMSWSNRGTGPGTWQIDHIVPFVSASSEEELKKIVHFSNLRPMWWEEHMLKSLGERRRLMVGK